MKLLTDPPQPIDDVQAGDAQADEPASLASLVPRTVAPVLHILRTKEPEEPWERHLHALLSPEYIIRG